MISRESFPRFLRAGVLAVLGLAAAFFASCNTTDESGHTYLKVHVDTSWYRYDSIQVLVDQGDASGPVRIFGGKVISASDLEKLRADGYRGGKATIVIRAYEAGAVVRQEDRKYDGATRKILEVVIVTPPGPDPDPDPDPVKSKDGLHLALSPRDTLVSIRDSVPFRAACRNDSGKLARADWDTDGDGAVDLTVEPDAESAALEAGRRFAAPGIYHPSLALKGAGGSTLQADLTVKVVEDRPVADAGPDTSIPASAEANLIGKAKDGLGKIVKQEWRVGDGAFAAAPDGKLAFKAPAAAGSVIVVFRATDDDDLVDEDSAVVRVSAPQDSVKDGLRLSLAPKDTLVSIRDSVAFTASAGNDNGKLAREDWDLDGDGTVDLTRNLDAASATLKAGFRFAKAGTYSPTLTIVGAKGASFQISVTVKVAEDKPVADAGPDTTLPPGAQMVLKGSGKDGLGRIVKREWSIAGGNFAVTADGTAPFKAPAAPGDVKAVFRVTDDDDLAAEDTVVIHVVSPAVAALTQLTMQGCVLAPAFSPDTLAYACAAPFGAASVTVTAKAQGTMSLNGKTLADGKAGDPIPFAAGKAVLSLSVANGTATRSYTITATLGAASGNNALGSLALSAGKLDPAFAADKIAYAAAVASTAASITVTAALADSSASLTVQGIATVSGKASGPIALAVGANAIAVVVTAQNGQKRTYTVTVTRQSGNADLKSLKAAPGTLAPAFTAANATYALSVGSATASLTVTAVPQDSGKAAMTLNGTALESGKATAVPLAQAVTTLTLVVSAEDKAVKRSYVLTVTKVDDAPPTAPAVALGTFAAPDRPAWTWTPGGGGNGTFRYKLDDANLATGAITTTALAFGAAADLAGGTHTLYVQERDSAGNWSASGKAAAVLAVLKPVADYSLEGHASDTAGANADLTLVNDPFLSQGIYINGISESTLDPAYSDAVTPGLAGFSATDFSADVDFKVDVLPSTGRPILTGGYSFRWMSGLLEADGKVGLLYNNSLRVAGTLTCSPGVWHTLKLRYAGGVAGVYLDGVLSASVTAALTMGGDYTLGAANPGSGTLFKGNLRNLRVHAGGVKIAQYPLSGDAKDITGKQSPINLVNAPFQSPGPGIACGGVYSGNFTSGNVAQTPALADLDMDDFAMTAVFSIAALPTVRMPVLVGGPTSRWLGIAVEPTGTLSLTYNNGLVQTTTANCAPAGKHTVTVRYSAASQMAAIYLNGVLAGSKSIPVLTHLSEKILSTSNYGNSTAFKGTLYRIKVDGK